MILLLIADDSLFKTDVGRRTVKRAAELADITAVLVNDRKVLSPPGGANIVRYNPVDKSFRPERPVRDPVDQRKLQLLRELLT